MQNVLLERFTCLLFLISSIIINMEVNFYTCIVIFPEVCQIDVFSFGFILL